MESSSPELRVKPKFLKVAHKALALFGLQVHLKPPPHLPCPPTPVCLHSYLLVLLTVQALFCFADVAHTAFSNGIFFQKPSLSESESEVTQLCLTLCNPVDCSLPGSSIHGILQARILEWVAISFSRGSSRPRDRTRVSHIVGRRFNL